MRKVLSFNDKQKLIDNISSYGFEDVIKATSMTYDAEKN